MGVTSVSSDSTNYPEYVDEDNIPDIWYPDFHRLYTTPDGSMKFEKSDLDWIEYITRKYGKAPEHLAVYAESDERSVPLDGEQ